MFRDFLNELDTKHLAFTTPQEVNEEQTQAKSQNKMSFYLIDNKIKQKLKFIFIKPSLEIKTNELDKLKKFQFDCTTKLIDQKKLVICSQFIEVELIVTTKAQNTQQLEQQFRTPLIFDFYQVSTKNSYNLRKAALLPFYPITITYDIVSIPFLIGLAAVGIEAPGNAALSTVF